MSDFERRLAFAVTAFLTCAACSGPNVSVQGQYLADTGEVDLGIYVVSPYPLTIPYLALMTGESATFSAGGAEPQTMGRLSGAWNMNHFTASLAGGGGDAPISFDADAVDDTSDGIADRLDVVAHFDAKPDQSYQLDRTDPFDDYRCWLGLEPGNDCIPALGPAECTVVPALATDYSVTVRIPFKDLDGDVSSGGTLAVGTLQELSGGLTWLGSTNVPIPGSGDGSAGPWTVSVTTPDLLSLAGTVDVDTTAIRASVGFTVTDAAGTSSEALQGGTGCPLPTS